MARSLEKPVRHIVATPYLRGKLGQMHHFQECIPGLDSALSDRSEAPTSQSRDFSRGAKKMTKMKLKAALAAAGALSLITASQGAMADVTTYNVTERFNQVVYNSTPDRDTYFTGSFTFDSMTQTVSNLQGTLSQAMTNANPALQATRFLGNQLSSVYDATLGGFLVTTFLLNNTDTFSNSGGVANTVGWATGGTKEITTNENAYVTIFVNAADPLASLTAAQNNTLAYADCTPGSLMGMGSGAKTCMTGWLTAAGAKGGTMQGVDQITQTISAVPEPENYAMFLAGLGMMGFVARRRQGR